MLTLPAAAASKCVLGVRYTTDGVIEQNDTCPICLDHLTGKPLCYPLCVRNCKNVYCVPCLEQCMNFGRRCPTCRQRLIGVQPINTRDVGNGIIQMQEVRSFTNKCCAAMCIVISSSRELHVQFECGHIMHRECFVRDRWGPLERGLPFRCEECKKVVKRVDLIRVLPGIVSKFENDIVPVERPGIVSVNSAVCGVCCDMVVKDRYGRKHVVTKPCGHIHHSYCYGSWLRSRINSVCPTCSGRVEGILYMNTIMNETSEPATYQTNAATEYVAIPSGVCDYCDDDIRNRGNCYVVLSCGHVEHGGCFMQRFLYDVNSHCPKCDLRMSTRDIKCIISNFGKVLQVGVLAGNISTHLDEHVCCFCLGILGKYEKLYALSCGHVACRSCFDTLPNREAMRCFTCNLVSDTPKELFNHLSTARTFDVDTFAAFGVFKKQLLVPDKYYCYTCRQDLTLYDRIVYCSNGLCNTMFCHMCVERHCRTCRLETSKQTVDFKFNMRPTVELVSVRNWFVSPQHREPLLFYGYYYWHWKASAIDWESNLLSNTVLCRLFHKLCLQLKSGYGPFEPAYEEFVCIYSNNEYMLSKTSNQRTLVSFSFNIYIHDDNVFVLYRDNKHKVQFKLEGKLMMDRNVLARNLKNIEDVTHMKDLFKGQTLY